MRIDPVLLIQGNLTMEEGLLVCHLLELAVRRGTYPARSVAVVTTHDAQMVWLDYCVRFVGCTWQANPVNLLKTVATRDWFHWLQAPVILASLVSATPGIMHDIWRSNTLTSRAQPELHLFGRFTQRKNHPTHGVSIAALHAVRWEADSATVSDTLERGGVLREAAVVEKVMHGTIYRLAVGGGGGALAVEAMEEAQEDPWGYSPGSADQLLHLLERIMANTRKDDVAVCVIHWGKL